MKKLVLLFSIITISLNTNAQEWTWMKGTDTLTQPGKYGIKGVSSPTNNPGSRHGAATWVDTNGDLWLFGGEGVTTNTVLCWLNDLWKYTVSTGEWTWIGGSNLPNQNGVYGTKGVPSTTNIPGAREFMMYWTDASGNFWMFGGDGFPAVGSISVLNDLWRYNPTTNEWTWMHGANFTDDPGVYGTKGVASPSNVPGARHGSGAAADASGNLWLFGGYGNGPSASTGNLNDLWRYNIASNQWTWIGGTNQLNQFGNYGTLSVTSSTNNPGGREFPMLWSDKSGNLWLFGGGGFAAASPQGHLNDFWKFNTASGNWTWMGGSTIVNQQGNYGSLNFPSTTNIPGGRFSSAGWTDQFGNLWLFGGTGYATAVVPGRLNDLFMYNTYTNEWTWVHGMNATNSNGIYGTMTVPAPFTTPGARYYNTYWPTSNGAMWLFGGLGFGALGNAPNNMNDLWRFIPDCSPVNLTSTANAVICNGNTTTLTVGSTSTINPVQWSLLSSTTTIGTGSVLITPTLNAIGSQTTYIYVASVTGCANSLPVNVTVNITPTVTISTDNPLICAGSTVNLTANGANTYAWNTSATGSVIAISPSVTTSYTVIGTDTSGCTNTSVLTQSVSACTGIASVIDNEWNQAVYPNPNNGSFNVSSTIDEAEFVLYNLIGQIVYREMIQRGNKKIKTEIARGVYLYSIQQNEKTIKQGKMAID